MRAELSRADWNDLFQDSPGYDELNFRSKQLARVFLPGSESGVTDRGIQPPAGVVVGQKLKAFFNRLVRTDRGERDIADLPLPLSLLATDIGSGERVAIRRGSLTQAMRASMSVPGLLAPTLFEGRKLVDGGLVDNLPVAEVRALCQADVLIAVNVGSPLLKADDVTGLLSVAAQMVNILTEQNVSLSLASLRASDIYIRPALDGISSGDFVRHSETADRGRAAAAEQASALQRLALPEAEFAAWQSSLRVAAAPTAVVERVEITPMRNVAPEAVARHVTQRPGMPLDLDALDRDLLRTYGDGHFESVDYALLGTRERSRLRVTPIEKPWGPNYLRLGFNLESNLDQGSTYSLRVGYQRTWINRLGGELLFSGQIGNSAGAGTEWYQPLDAAQRAFFATRLAYRRTRADLYEGDARIAQYRTKATTAELQAGLNIGTLGQVRLGWRDQQRRAAVETGTPIVQGARVDSRGWAVGLDFDQLDRLYIPTSGWSLNADWFDAGAAGYTRAEVAAQSAFPFGHWVLGARASYVGSTRGRLPPADAASLGGFMNLSAYAPGQLFGDDIRYGHVRLERIVGRLPMGLRGDLRLGLALEFGRVGLPYAETARTGRLRSTTLYLGGESPLGPAYVGLGRGDGGVSNVYLFLGTP
jgi:NTE family protein